MTQGKMVVAAVAVLVVAGGGFYAWKNPAVLQRFRTGSGGVLKLAPPKAGEAPKDLAQTYQNEQYGFSVNYPTGFTVTSFANPAAEDGTPTGDTIIIQNASTGVQILVSPFDEEGNVLTQERIKEDVPDLVINNVLPVELGANGKGVAFESNNEAYGGASRDVWFVYKGNLYQITTYLSQDALLQAILGTWKFVK